MGRPGRDAAGLVVLVAAPVGLALVRSFGAGQQACVAESELREGFRVSHEYEELCFSPERGAEDSNTALYYGEACFDASRGWLVEWKGAANARPPSWTDGKRKACAWRRKEDSDIIYIYMNIYVYTYIYIHIYIYIYYRERERENY